jgi:hypothetical protein
MLENPVGQFVQATTHKDLKNRLKIACFWAGHIERAEFGGGADLIKCIFCLETLKVLRIYHYGVKPDEYPCGEEAWKKAVIN